MVINHYIVNHINELTYITAKAYMLNSTDGKAGDDRLYLALCLSIIPLLLVGIPEMWPLAYDKLWIHFLPLKEGIDMTKEFLALPGGYLKITLNAVKEKHQ